MQRGPGPEGRAEAPSQRLAGCLAPRGRGVGVLAAPPPPLPRTPRTPQLRPPHLDWTRLRWVPTGLCSVCSRSDLGKLWVQRRTHRCSFGDRSAGSCGNLPGPASPEPPRALTGADALQQRGGGLRLLPTLTSMCCCLSSRQRCYRAGGTVHRGFQGTLQGSRADRSWQLRVPGKLNRGHGGPLDPPPHACGAPCSLRRLWLRGGPLLLRPPSRPGGRVLPVATERAFPHTRRVPCPPLWRRGPRDPASD